MLSRNSLPGTQTLNYSCSISDQGRDTTLHAVVSLIRKPAVRDELTHNSTRNAPWVLHSRLGSLSHFGLILGSRNGTGAGELTISNGKKYRYIFKKKKKKKASTSGKWHPRTAPHSLTWTESLTHKYKNATYTACAYDSLLLLLHRTDTIYMVHWVSKANYNVNRSHS